MDEIPKTGRRRRKLIGLAFAGPALLFMCAFMLYPVASLAWLGFHDYSPLRSAKMPWVGLANYANALSDPETYDSIRITVIFTVSSVAIEVVAGLAIAVTLSAVTLQLSGRFITILNRLFAGLLILPLAAPTVVAAVLWKMLLDPQIGPVSAAVGRPIAWFSDYALLSVILIDAWKTVPFVAFILYAAIMSIEHTQFEAARMDGANVWQEFWYLTLPSIFPVVVVTTAFRTVDAFTKAFDIVFATTGGGPDRQTMVFPLYIWRTAFSSLHFGAASALAVLAIIISGLWGVGLLFLDRSESTK
jgi:ABC-type sugar transport system permease subunit